MAEAYRRQAADPSRSDHWSGPAAMVDRLAARLSVGPSATVLDVGCGVGGPARRLRDVSGCRVVAIDVLPSLVAEARGRVGDGGIRFAAASASALPFREGSFDQVWALGVVAHMGDPGAFTREASRVVRTGGVVAVTEALWDGRRRPRFEATAPRPWRPLTAASLARAITGAGLSVLQEEWPGRGIPGAMDASDPALRADLADGRLAPALVLGWKR